MPYIIELNLLLAKSDHEGPRIELKVLFVNACWQDIVVVQIFSFLFVCILYSVLSGRITAFILTLTLIIRITLVV